MLAIILKILNILGIVILVLLGILLVAILLVLFFPITYKVYGKKDSESISAWAKANWLFGLARLRFAYPEPGVLTVKVLFFTVYEFELNADMEEALEDGSPVDETAEEKENSATKVVTNTDSTEPLTNSEDFFNKTEDSNIDSNNTFDSKNVAKESKKSISDIIIEKYEKIKYTIQKICDKIKDILENLAFYKELFQEKQTKELMKHAFLRLEKVLKHIKPRKFKADLLIGTGEPDTTGYMLGVYGMLSPKLPGTFHLTPDFTRQVYEGEIYAAGHIMVFTVLINVLWLVLDEKLWILVRKIKKHNSQKQKK